MTTCREWSSWQLPPILFEDHCGKQSPNESSTVEGYPHVRKSVLPRIQSTLGSFGVTLSCLLIITGFKGMHSEHVIGGIDAKVGRFMVPYFLP